jgi:hypothetical protein
MYLYVRLTVLLAVALLAPRYGADSRCTSGRRGGRPC